MDYLKGLNPAQRDAVLQMNGPVMIIAGAGSGKTRVITMRVAHLVASGVDAFNILVLTFTNKAAREMRERIMHVVGEEAKNIWMGTFHSVFAKILRVEADKIGYPNNFTIYDTDDSKSVIRAILKEMQLDDKLYNANFVYNRISGAKNNLISWQEYQQNEQIQADDFSSGRGQLGKIYETYAGRCFRAGAMDFDDLLFKTNELLKRYPEVLNKYQHKFKYLMVDEYQDTNFSQYLIIWSGNIPEETGWFLARTTKGWGYIAWGLVLLHFAAPFTVLLMQDLKRRPKTLAMVGLFILLMRLVDMYWLIGPTPRVNTAGSEGGWFTLSWLDIVAPIAVGGIWLWYFFGQLMTRPLVPVMDPFLESAIEHGHGH